MSPKIPTKINKKIVGVSIVSKDIIKGEKKPCYSGPYKRPEVLTGQTYKISPACMEDSIYITINNDTVGGIERPVEFFIESKHLESLQWIKFNARVISALLRESEPMYELVIQEMFDTYDPTGNYIVPGKGFAHSVVHHIGIVLKEHCVNLGLVEGPMDKKKEIERIKAEVKSSGDFPSNARDCPKCHKKALLKMDGCDTCLNCGDSKCG